MTAALTLAALQSILPHAGPRAATYHPHLVAAMGRYQINTRLRIAAFIAQIGHESADLSRSVENLNYGLATLLTKFGRNRISAAAAEKYGRTPAQRADQEAIANIIYGGNWGRENLGNTADGDGWRFRGRGLIQITGRTNYLACSRGLYGDDRLITSPETLEYPAAACLSAAWFWDTRKLNTLADAGSFETITRRINGGLNGQAERAALYATALKVLT